MLALLIIIIVFTSCKKEQQTYDNTNVPAKDMKLATMINNFKERGVSPLKSASEMTVDSAIWYIGATANFTYGDASFETERTWTDTILFCLPVNNGKITENEVYAKYADLVDNLRIKYQAKNEENKQLVAVYIKTLGIDANTLNCKATAVFACGFTSNSNCTFNNIDSWKFGQVNGSGGICAGVNAGSFPSSDAAMEMQKRIMACKAVPSGNCWFETLDNYTQYLMDPLLYPINPLIAISNYRYSHLYWNSDKYPDFNGCINPEDLNFYLTKIKELIYKDTQNGGIRPVGLNFVDINMVGEESSENGFTIYKHIAIVQYGILHLSLDPPKSLD